MYTMSTTPRRSFGPDGCQVPIGKGICGETRTLDIIKEFKRLYEEKIKEIDMAGGGDCLQEKIKLQQDWIGDLTEQNEMLVRAVEELEHEATERVNMLEEKLQQSAQCICEVMNRYREYDVTTAILKEPREKIFQLENDLKNLMEFIRRIRENDEWSVGGLKFYEISVQDLFGEKSDADFVRKTNCSRSLIGDIIKEEKKVKDRDCKIQELQMKYADVEILTSQLQCKKEECDTLQKNMVDMRQALTEEVATKHDTILKLKKDCQELEDRCIQADKQTAFKDDIIKELRKEIKQLKQQVTQDEINNLTRTIDELQGTLQRTKQIQEVEEQKNNEKINILKNVIEEVENKLKEAQEKAKVCKICRGRSRVGFADNTEVQTDLIDPEQLEQDIQIDLLEYKDNIIKTQNDALNWMQQELQSLKETEIDLRREKEEYCQNIEYLKSKINELEHVEADSDKNMNMDKLMELIQNRDVIIRNQNETLILMQQELESLKETEASMRSEREKYNQNIQHLKNRINELEVNLQSADGRADNLQMAVDLYMNSINVLEASQAKYEIEIDQQRATISNLQKALVDTKQELDSIKQKCEENVSSSYWATRWFGFSESKPPNNDERSVHDI